MINAQKLKHVHLIFIIRALKMNISLDELIKMDKDKQKHKHHKNRYHNHDHHRSHNHRNRNYDRQDRQERQDRNERNTHRETRLLLQISNLHYSVTKEQLQEICDKFGKVKICRIEWDKMGRSNQKATVQYFNRADTENALQNLKQIIFQEQKLQVQLVQDDNMPQRRHEIRKTHNNYNNRSKQYSKNFRGQNSRSN